MKMKYQLTYNKDYLWLKDSLSNYLDPNFDIYQSAMNIWFDIAAELYFRKDDLPYYWEYYPGTKDPRDLDSPYYEIIASADSDSLYRMGNLMYKYTRILKRNGYEN